MDFIGMHSFRLEGEIDEQLCRRACAELRQRLRAGETCRAEDVFHACPALLDHAEFAVEVIYTEFVAREASGYVELPEFWFGRFPQFRERLERLLHVHAQLAAVTPPEVPSKAPHASPARRVAGYEIVQELGRGGMGVVYLARQLQLNRLVAIKMVLAGAHADPVHSNRFIAEARAVARLHHPNIVQIYEVGEHEGCPFLALEYVEGGSLDKQQRGEPLEQRAAARLIETLARAIHHAHENGIVHRDLKPANILLQLASKESTAAKSTSRLAENASKRVAELDTKPDVDSNRSPLGRYTLAATGSRNSHADLVPKITDFGLAKDLADQNGLTRTGAVLGTPSYMAPEQARGGGQEIGPTTDVYSLGAILYELLTGRPPFKGDSAIEILEQVRYQEPPSVTQLQPGTALDLGTITHKCLSKEPWQRYATALALAEDLARYQADEPIRARPVSSLEQLFRWCRRQPAMAGMLAALIVVFLCGFVGVAWKWHDALVESAAKEEALKDEIRERRGKELALEKANANLYFHQVSLAEHEWAGNNVGYAERLLENCPQEMRQWEWNYLWGLCHLGFVRRRDPLASMLFLQFDPDGTCRAISLDPNRTKFWNVNTSAETGIGPFGLRWQGLVLLGRTGNSLAWPQDTGARPRFTMLAVEDRQPRVFNAVTGLMMDTFAPLQGDEQPTALSHDGRKIITQSQSEHLLRLRAARTGEELRRLPFSGKIGQGTMEYSRSWFKEIVFRPDDRQVAIATGGKILIWDLERDRLAAQLSPRHVTSVYALAYRPDGKRLASGGTESSVTLWDTDSWKEERSFVGHT